MANYTGNKKIAINTFVIYARMIIGILIGLLTTRYVLKALGVSDYGLYNVLGGIVTMLNIVGIAMHTTTRRYINVEMGKQKDGNLNKVFNISIAIHILLAGLLFLVAMTVGIWYIFSYLQINPAKLNDALFVFILSTIVASINLIMIPFQGLMAALEKFFQMSIFQIVSALLKIPLVVLLLMYQGNVLRFYAVGMCVVTTMSFLLMGIYCYVYHYPIVRPRIYKDKVLFKEMLSYNNYTTIGAAAYLSRSQGSTIIINYFFGTMVNGAFAIANQIENFVIQFVNNLNTAATPQITQSYASKDYNHSFNLLESVSKYSVYIMLLILFPFFVELETLLKIWLGVLPDYTLVLCQWTLISIFLRSIAAGVDPIIQATGKIKWYQITASSLLMIGLPVSFLFFYLGCQPYSIILVYIIADSLYKVMQFYFLKKYTGYSFLRFYKAVYAPTVLVLLIMVLYYIFYNYVLLVVALSSHIVGFFITLLFTTATLFLVGLNKDEQNRLISRIRLLCKANKRQNDF